MFTVSGPQRKAPRKKLPINPTVFGAAFFCSLCPQGLGIRSVSGGEGGDHEEPFIFFWHFVFPKTLLKKETLVFLCEL